MRKSLAVLLYLFAGCVFIWSAVEVHDAWFGVPAGLTGGRARVALPGKASLEVRGGFVRSVDGTNVAVRSLSPTPVLAFANEGREPASFSVSLANVKPLALRAASFPTQAPLSPQEPVEFKAADPGVIRFTVSLAAGATRTLAFEQRPQAESAGAAGGTPLVSAASASVPVRFFAFGGVREGIGTLRELFRIANDESPDFLVGLGDIYYRANVDAILRIDELLPRCSVPIYLLPGEIEYRSPDEPASDPRQQLERFYPLDRHETMFGPGNNDFAFGGWRFVFLDNARQRNRASLRWLAGLPPGDPAAPRTLFFSHIPPFDPREKIFKRGMTTGVAHEHRRVVAALGNLGAAAAFFGHYHGYARGEAAGVPCYVTSAAGVKLPRGESPHFLDVRLSPEGTVRVVRRSLENGTKNGAKNGAPGNARRPAEPALAHADDADTTRGGAS